MRIAREIYRQKPKRVLLGAPERGAQLLNSFQIHFGLNTFAVA